ncbi:ABC transporter ATP-binding protein [Ponticoccus sp. SC2-23]|uniref:ABC transporter ATP-binding protein n=1 Tax=Alexandriicola marinus TaxID=2081710 RepID=UPI000FD9A07B|nr:ABC transporter ATP-binding protein [Alexandriicola marinus]MBM1221445.1 ABC transporter ATP-binding protein [Ponticoccus sp. SC6-9]MBM1226486.1 ABC transporter ATP-binding protein [Ponticoccus sp. SC6-15]MBM1230437.1 ABC transporter ATP-binding protein [Ponticoccus sp. SC6-38]MBM1234960.1 ABC transporter ATP-binding protein [Ponticoccus sp. SC6-45]MBM1239458.1 ABC transporter ATP-binding protein [Ponticoccus sp. SC6-49]MBM1243240.1 ABC transporter ATP-binding protein [Ponticoccus sp. SC2-
MELRLEKFTKAFGPVTVIQDMDLTVGSGEMMALLGPSGCGKSTTLFAICGIHKMTGGRLYFGDRDVTSVPAQQRSVGVVFQNYALYPHMTAEQNIGFPLKVMRQPKAEIAKEVQRLADLVQIGDLLDRRPAQLSGGQQQRVALARAMIRKPDVLLLDEPLANLDAKLRLEMRAEIRRIQRETGITAILVTHDQVEAMSMCDRIALMRDGKIVQLDTPERMYADPASQFVAGFLGNPPISFLPARAGEQLAIGQSQVLPRPAGLEVQGDIVLGIRPEHFGPQHGQGLHGEVIFVEPQGREELVDVQLDGGGILRAILPTGDPVKLGDRVNWGVSGGNILAFSTEGVRL